MEASNKKELIEQEMTNIIQSARLVEVSYEKLKAFRHDYKNILLSLSAEDDREGRSLLQKWEKRFLATDSQYENIMLQMMKIKSLPVRSLISSKTTLFIGEGVSTDISIIGEIKELYMDEFDLIRILGIFLDNAFEEAQCMESGWIRMGILADKEIVTIVIENNCGEMVLSPEGIIKKGFTTKGEGHGIGLSNVSDIMESYKQCSFQLGKREETVFFVELTLRPN